MCKHRDAACDGAQVTQENGFDLMVRKVAAEIVDRVDATDHKAGREPFCARAGS